MISELFLPDLLLTISKGTLSDQADFFAALYAKQESWREPLGSTFPPLEGKYTPDANVAEIKVNNIPINSWLEFQQFIDDAYTAAQFIDIWRINLSASEYARYLARVGLISKLSSITTLTASDGTVLAVERNTPVKWVIAWNTLRVPYERNTVQNTTFPYIRFVQTLSDKKDYFRISTFNFDGTV